MVCHLRRLLVTCAVICAGCNDDAASRLVVLYRDSISEGSSVVALANHDDPTGEWATGHCEALKRVYEAQYKNKYYCSTVVFEKFRPHIVK
jgi:hypothetical protein